MTQGRRLALIGMVAVLGVAGFVIAQNSGSDKKSSTSSSTTTSGGSRTGTATGAVNAPVQIVVKNAKPVGGVKKIKVSKGDPVRFTVTSDVADEVHVHGYDFHKDVEKGGSVSFHFPAKIDGVFVIELESRGEQIASLEVEP